MIEIQNYSIHKGLEYDTCHDIHDIFKAQEAMPSQKSAKIEFKASVPYLRTLINAGTVPISINACATESFTIRASCNQNVHEMSFVAGAYPFLYSLLTTGWELSLGCIILCFGSFREGDARLNIVVPTNAAARIQADNMTASVSLCVRKMVTPADTHTKLDM